MDSESADSRTKGAWDPLTQLRPFLTKWTSSSPTPDFVVDEVWRGMVASLGFDSGSGVPEELLKFWDDTLKEVYKGDEGRRKVRMALVCLLDRDGLLLRLEDVKCPVYWLQVSLKIIGKRKGERETWNGNGMEYADNIRAILPGTPRSRFWKPVAAGADRAVYGVC